MKKLRFFDLGALPARKILFVTAAILCIGFAAAAGEVIEVSSRLLTLRWENDRMIVLTPKASAPTLTFSVGGGFRAVPVHRNLPGIVLRSGDRLVSFRLDRELPMVTVSTFANSPDVELRYDGNFLVLPDLDGDDLVREPAAAGSRVPGFRPLAMVLGEGGNSVLSVFTPPGAPDFRISGDFKTLTLPPSPGFARSFGLWKQPGVWHAARTPLNDIKVSEIPGWQPPAPALWQASLPLRQDYIPSGDGSRCNWNILTPDAKGRPRGLSPGGVFTNREQRQSWYSGYENIQRYPAELTAEGKLLLKFPGIRPEQRLKADPERPVLIYAWAPADNTPAALPLPLRFVGENQRAVYAPRRNPWAWFFPATCGCTQRIEKIFYRGEAARELAKIDEELALMECFVRYVNSRIAHHDRILARISALPGLPPAVLAAIADGKQLLDSRRPALAKLPQFFADSAAFAQLARTPGDPEELENRAKELGRKIRAYGGMQDSLAGRLRHAMKNIRRAALLEYMRAPAEADRQLLRQVYDLTGEALTLPSPYEGK